MGKFDTIPPDTDSFKKLSDENIKTYMESLIKQTGSELFNPTITESALSGFSVPTKIFDLEAKITTYFADFFEGLESVECDGFPEDKPKKSVRLFCFRL